MNAKKSVELKSGTIKFKNYFKQIAVPFKVYYIKVYLKQKSDYVYRRSRKIYIR